MRLFSVHYEVQQEGPIFQTGFFPRGGHLGEGLVDGEWSVAEK